MPRKLTLAAIGFAALVVLAAACGGVERDPNLREAAERTEATGTVRMEMSVQLKAGPADFDWRCDGALDFARERFRALCPAPAGSADAEDYELREIQGTTYVRGGGLEGDKPWTRFPSGEDDAGSFGDLSPERALELLTRASLQTERVGEERVRDEETVRYALTVDCDDAASSTLSCSGDTAVVDVWVDDDGLVRRIRLDESDGSVAVEFFDFGEPVDVEAPSPDEVQDFKDVFPPRCSGEPGAPITTEQALGALRRHGFDAKRAPYGCGGGVAAVLSNLPDDAPESHQALGHGLLTCHVLTGGEGHAFVIQGGFGAPDTRHVDRDLENVQCSLVVEDASAEPAIDRLDAALAELKRAVRP